MNSKLSFAEPQGLEPLAVESAAEIPEKLFFKYDNPRTMLGRLLVLIVSHGVAQRTVFLAAPKTLLINIDFFGYAFASLLLPCETKKQLSSKDYIASPETIGHLCAALNRYNLQRGGAELFAVNKTPHRSGAPSVTRNLAHHANANFLIKHACVQLRLAGLLQFHAEQIERLNLRKDGLLVTNKKINAFLQENHDFEILDCEWEPTS